MVKLKSKIKQKQSPKETMWKTQACKFTTSHKMNVESCLTEFSATKIVLWNCHVDNNTNIRYDVILGRDLLTLMVLDLKFSVKVITGGEGQYEGCLAHMVDFSNYNFKPSMKKKGKPDELYTIS